jgi:hypothetical protein
LIIFDGPLLCPEKIFDPPEPAEIHPRPARTRIFLFTAIPAPAARQSNDPRAPSSPRYQEKMLPARPSPRGPADPTGRHP